jgi:hypothetical protein
MNNSANVIRKTSFNNFKFGLWSLTPLSTIFELYRRVSFIGGGNWSARRKQPTYRKSLTNLSHNVVSSTPHHERSSNSLFEWSHALIAQDKVFKSYAQVLVYNMNKINNVFYIKDRYKRFLVII